MKSRKPHKQRKKEISKKLWCSLDIFPASRVLHNFPIFDKKQQISNEFMALESVLWDINCVRINI